MNFELTDRERQISDLVQFGLTDKGIASHLGISPWTVRSHLRRIFAKVGVCSRVELAAWNAWQYSVTDGQTDTPQLATLGSPSSILPLAYTSRHTTSAVAIVSDLYCVVDALK